MKHMTELSPQAQAVLDAFNNANDGHYEENTWHPPEAEHQLAAALRAAADQCADGVAHWKLYAIAAELDDSTMYTSNETLPLN